ncbi:beta-lactamase family protein [Marinobacter hydrocarbonoclasticus]|uniref:serine hydrolase domain-containing protein n=1 Tax=Marinobacter nauticus TaxID=2743 RepID=UPI001A8F1629|nr:serine hydrolase domain-containing protein [Marinobacter nauticus]MBN8241370.1 beta-lactamase family protein [Marinobacter nauticus]
MEEFIKSSLINVKAPATGVVVIHNGHTVINDAFGLADVENHVKAHPRSAFKLASITKHFTAFAILRLVESGKIKLSDSLLEYFPEYDSLNPKITIENLLNHTSGIPGYTELTELFSPYEKIEATHEQMLSVFIDQPLLFEPGSSFGYSNSGYYLLGLIIERASGYTYEQCLKKEFFNPIGMHDTRYASDKSIIPNRVRGYDTEQGGSINTGLQNCEYISMNPPYAAGGLCSTTTDMAKWLSALLAGRVLGSELMLKACSPTKLKNGLAVEYGYGLNVGTKHGVKAVGHDGGIPGFASAFMMYPESNTAILVLVNDERSDPWAIEDRISSYILRK